MMKFRSIRYFFEESFRSVFRNRIMSITSILTVASCIFILVFSYCFAINIDYALEQLENSIGLSVIIDDSATTQEVEELRRKILEIENVDVAQFISAKEALQSFAESVGDESGIIIGFEDDNPMPRSFTLKLKDVKKQLEVVKEIESYSEMGVDKVISASAIIEKLSTINDTVRIISVIIVLVLGLLSVIIIMNTIKLTVANRSTDINIMKYVGATDWFIKWPFIIEGIIIGVVGAIIPVIFASLSYNKALGFIEDGLSATSKLFTFKQGYEIFPSLTIAMILLGIFIGSLGSTLSMRKYLDV